MASCINSKSQLPFTTQAYPPPRVNFLGMSSNTISASVMPAESSDTRDLQAQEMAAVYWIDNLTPHELCRRIRSALIGGTLLPHETEHLWNLLRRSDGSFDYREDFRDCEPTIVHSRISRKIHSRMLSSDEIRQLLLILPKMAFDLERIMNTIADDTPRHCARCHRDYRERFNNLRVCRLRSHDIPDVISVEGRTLPCYKYDCCKMTFTRELQAGPCIRRHFVGSPRHFGECLARGCP
jgi:hypothetical protein